MAAILRISLFQPFRRLIGPAKTFDRTGSKFEIQRTNFSQKPTVHWEVDTKVAKDVVLFNYADGKFHKMLNLFAVTQFAFWLYLAQFSFTTLRDVPVKRTENEDVPWYRNINLGDNKYRNGLSLMCICVGSLVLGCSWMYALKAVQTVVLRKGGKDVTFVTHSPFNKIRYLDVPLTKVSASQSRTGAKVNIPIKIKGHMGYFLVDMKGQFHKPELFDATVGLKRILK